MDGKAKEPYATARKALAEQPPPPRLLLILGAYTTSLAGIILIGYLAIDGAHGSPSLTLIFLSGFFVVVSATAITLAFGIRRRYILMLHEAAVAIMTPSETEEEDTPRRRSHRWTERQKCYLPSEARVYLEQIEDKLRMTGAYDEAYDIRKELLRWEGEPE
ncbi:hypothetical protein [Streptomyces collinus]|uniref:hypothetical protein n=1 Tax=Streptomyces collinus TaxID=42684 RepID=UPI0033FC9D0F